MEALLSSILNKTFSNVKKHLKFNHNLLPSIYLFRVHFKYTRISIFRIREDLFKIYLYFKAKPLIEFVLLYMYP